MKELVKNIKNEVFEKLAEIYNDRKAELGLVSIQNNLIDNLKVVICNWEKQEYERLDIIEKLCDN